MTRSDKIIIILNSLEELKYRHEHKLGLYLCNLINTNSYFQINKSVMIKEIKELKPKKVYKNKTIITREYISFTMEEIWFHPKNYKSRKKLLEKALYKLIT